MMDADGNGYVVDESVAFEPWWTVVVEAGQLVSTEPGAKIAKELVKIRKALEKR